MYSKIEVIDTEYPEKYLLISNNNTLYIGVIVKDILVFLKNEVSIQNITYKINVKHKIQLTEQNIYDTKKSIDKFLVKKNSSSLYKIATILNPNKIPIPKQIFIIFSTKIFSVLFLFLFFVNIFFLFKIPPVKYTNSFSENIIIFSSLLFIFFLHEFGHSISAKKFNVNVKEIGFGFYYFFPVFYVNLNETWKLKKGKRTMTNLSGIYFQLILGLILLILIHSTSENIIILIFKMNITLIILNLNPFLKFDGYWVLSDFFEDNNLLETSNSLLTKKNNLKKTNKFRYAIILYTILRLIFILYVVILILKKIILIINKSIENIKLENHETIFIFILTIYLLRIIFIKSKKYLTLQKKSSFFEYEK